MPLAIEILIVLIGILLLALALIGSGISRRLMTIPRMHKWPRIVIAVLGVVMLAGGGWLLMTGNEKDGPSYADLKEHIPSALKNWMTCEQHSEAPEGGVEAICTSSDSAQTVYYSLLPEVNSMQAFYEKRVTPEALTDSECSSVEDFQMGGKTTYGNDEFPVLGDVACQVDNDESLWMTYTDRRFNIVVEAKHAVQEDASGFLDWINDTTPAGSAESTPATPTQTAAQ
ncbi:hypothetical protein OG920_11250 [Streptomyces europaeiscabiei]|uniref:hypothetical protein n=1 Tax=Streptomyces TaxID=1883 RepID=UPI000A3905AE|nr:MULTISPECIES: hypothetical protein [Streptomyces]MDX3633116.1 hypothetical protein [Streptomyces europaeiscabiei]MDX3650375.1 hypothetical protein [Streptomyces europaeiscabiei]